MRNILCILLILLIFNSCKQKTSNLNNSRDLSIKKEHYDSTARQDTIIDDNQTKESIFTILADELPRFQNGEDDLRKYLRENTDYPKSAIESNIEGRVFVRFVIMKNGTVDSVRIVRSLSDELDSACIAVFENMPKWKPGKLKGKTVNFPYIMPITFSLNDNNDNKAFGVIPNREVVESKEISVKLFPNPCVDFFKIELSTKFLEISFQIISLNGQIVKAGSIHSENDQINVNELNNGMYLVKFTSKELGLNKTEKLIIKK